MSLQDADIKEIEWLLVLAQNMNRPGFDAGEAERKRCDLISEMAKGIQSLLQELKDNDVIP